MSTNIILLGYRGVGKSTISNIIGKKLNLPVISIDKKLSERIGNLQDFIKKNGWAPFRQEETKCIRKLDIQNSIIDCGGGVVESPENMDILKALGSIFYISATIETIASRLNTSSPRLSLSGNDVLTEISNILEKRDPLYRKYSDYIIESDTKTPEETANIILDYWM